MTAKVFALDTQPGIQRDGTVFDAQTYSDGRWVRFQRGRPRKILGYSVISDQLKGPSRGVWVNPSDAITTVYSGYSDGLQSLDVDDNGVGSGITDYTLSNFTANYQNLWQFDGFYDVGGAGVAKILAHPGQNLVSIDHTTNTPVLSGDAGGTTFSQIGVFTDTNAYLNGTVNVTVSQANSLIGAGQTVTGTGIPANTSVVSSVLANTSLDTVTVTGTSGTFSCASTDGLYNGQTVTVSGTLGTAALSGVAVTGTGGTFSCTATTGLYTGQPLLVGGIPATQALASVAVSGTDGVGNFTCTSATGLNAAVPVTVSGTYGTTTLASVAITSTQGAFSCTASTLYVGMPITVTGSPPASALASVAVTGTAGECSCTATSGLYIGQPVAVTGTITTGTATGISTNRIYYIVATNGTSTFQLSATYGGSPITTTAGTTDALVFSVVLATGIESGQTYYVIATNGTSTFTLSRTLNGSAIATTINSLTGLTFSGPAGTGLVSGRTYYIIGTPTTTAFTLALTAGGTAITGVYGATTGLSFVFTPYSGLTSGTTYYLIATNGTSTFTLSATSGGSAITTVNAVQLTGLTFTVTKSIGLTPGTTYYVVATNYSTTFTLSATSGGSPVTTIVTSTSGLVFTLGLYTRVVLSNAATASGASTLTFNNNVSVSGGVVSLHPYVFVYGNNGLIKNCAAGNLQDWVSADANEVNVATGKVVQGLPVRGGSNAPSGLFWSLDSLVRVSYIGGTGTPPQYWRYDIITSQSSILSSQSAIEYDGIYYWCGVDRFLLYNGVVKEIPNTMNQNYFFDNLNYAQRQKVWACKVPRYGEVWWFYPRGDATECTDAIIYNVRENIWYDAGEALGARRSAGYFSQVFSRPIMANWETSVQEALFSANFDLVAGVTEYPLDAYPSNQIRYGQLISGPGIVDGTFVSAVRTNGAKTSVITYSFGSPIDGIYTNVTMRVLAYSALITPAPAVLSDGEVKATIVVSGGAFTSVTITSYSSGVAIGNVLTPYPLYPWGASGNFESTVTDLWPVVVVFSTAPTTTGTTALTFSTPPDRIQMLQHEVGTDAINGQNVNAIESYFETSDLGLVGGGPSQTLLVGENKWLRLDRVEPDFIMEGEMALTVTGRPFAQSEDVTSQPYVFDANTGKIDMREQRRELRLKFTSNVAGGTYQVGRVLLNADIGDVRPY